MSIEYCICVTIFGWYFQRFIIVTVQLLCYKMCNKGLLGRVNKAILQHEQQNTPYICSARAKNVNFFAMSLHSVSSAYFFFLNEQHCHSFVEYKSITVFFALQRQQTIRIVKATAVTATAEKHNHKIIAYRQYSHELGFKCWRQQWWRMNFFLSLLHFFASPFFLSVFFYKLFLFTALFYLSRMIERL